MAMTTTEILKAIDSMELYKKDYDVILKLLNYNNPSLFTKILEEVIEGNLFWSDFEEILNTKQYENILESELKNQKELDNMLTNLAKLRNNLGFPELTNENSNFVILDDEKYNQFYKNEIANIRQELLYELIQPTRNDNILTSACKVRLYNALRNGEILAKNPDMYTYTENIVFDGNNNAHEYISPDDILLFLKSYIIPLDYKMQTLTEFDRTFMHANNLNENEMKKIKSLERLLRYETMKREGDTNEWN